MVTVLIFLVAAAISVALLVLELYKHRQRTSAADARVLEMPDDRASAAWPDDDLPPVA